MNVKTGIPIYLSVVVATVLFSQTPPQLASFIEDATLIGAIDFSKISAADIEATERHRDALRAGAKAALIAQDATISDQGATLDDVKTAGEQTRKAIADYQAAAESQIAKGNQAIVALEHVLEKLHLAKWILIGIWLAVCAFVALKVPAFGVYVGAGLAAAGIGFIWWWI